MIPKIIHYVWLGGNPLPKKHSDCIDTWKELCPDYEIVRWDENNFDIDGCLWVKQAMDKKMYAFASDAIRFYALYKQGGIYMDTDTYLVKNPEPLLNEDAIMGCDRNRLWINAEFLGSSKGNAFFKFLSDYYYTRPLKEESGKVKQTFSVVMALTELTNQYYGKFKAGKEPFLLAAEDKPSLKLYTGDYFSPKDYMTGKLRITDNTYAVHDHTGSWWSPRNKRGQDFASIMRRVMGRHIFRVFESMVTKGQRKIIRKSLKAHPIDNNFNNNNEQ